MPKDNMLFIVCCGVVADFVLLRLVVMLDSARFEIA